MYPNLCTNLLSSVWNLFFHEFVMKERKVVLLLAIKLLSMILHITGDGNIILKTVIGSQTSR